MPDGSSLATRIRSAAGDLTALQPVVLEAGPWPLAERFDHSDEASWGPPEILAHVDEMLAYWLGEAERLLEARDGETAEFGRVATDPVRLAVIARDRTVPLRELFARARSEAERVAARIAELDADDVARIGRHASRGEMTVGELFERFVAAHLEDHVGQLRAALEASDSLPTA